MNNKIKMSIIKLVSLEDEILDVYREIIKKEIYDEDITLEIEKIKELKKEEEFLYELSYEELKEILNYIEESEELYYMLMQRISNLIGIVIDKFYLKERLEETEEDIDEEYIEYINKKDVVVEYLMRDLVLLKIKKLEDAIKYTNEDVRKRLINYNFLYLYSNIAVEDEILNNKFDLSNLHLINKLTTQLSELEKELIEELYNEIGKQYIIRGSIQNLLNINNILLNEGRNEENSIFIEAELIINTSFLKAEMEIFNIKNKTIIELLNNKIDKNNNYIIKDVDSILNSNQNNNTNYLTLIRKK